MVRRTSNRRPRRRHGFTLIELMVVVAIIGILVAVAIPRFLAYRYRSRRAEAYTNLSAIADMEKSYFGEYSTYVDTAGKAEPGSSSGTLPGPEKRVWTAGANATFSTLGYAPEGSVYYDYGISVGCGAVPACFTAAAYGDADGNGRLAVIEYAHPDATGTAPPDVVEGYGIPTDPQTGAQLVDQPALNYTGDLY